MLGYLDKHVHMRGKKGENIWLWNAESGLWKTDKKF